MMTRPTQSESVRERAGLATPYTSLREHGCDTNADRETPTGASVAHHNDHEEKLVGVEALEGTEGGSITRPPLVPGGMSSGVMDPECPVLFPDEDEWRSPSRAQSLTPEDSCPGDTGEFHSEDEVDLELGSPDREMYPLTIEHEETRNDSPLHALSWVDESHPGWRMIRTVMDSGATDSVAPPTLAPSCEHC